MRAPLGPARTPGSASTGPAPIAEVAGPEGECVAVAHAVSSDMGCEAWWRLAGFCCGLGSAWRCLAGAPVPVLSLVAMRQQTQTDLPGRSRQTTRVAACGRANSSGALAAVLGEPARAPEARFHQVGAGANGAGLVADAGAGERDAAEGGLVGSLRRRILGR